MRLPKHSCRERFSRDRAGDVLIEHISPAFGKRQHQTSEFIETGKCELPSKGIPHHGASRLTGLSGKPINAATKLTVKTNGDSVLHV